MRVVILLLLLAGLRAETLVCLGDSLTAGHGLDEAQAWPALIQERASSEAPAWKVVNAGLSGDTSAGGLRRVDWLLRAKPDLVFVCLGANDGLRGLDPAATKANLLAIVDRFRAGGARVAIGGMRLPMNYGGAAGIREAFEAVYPAIAQERSAPLLPFLLEGVAMQPALNLADGIHPNAEGQQRVAEQVWTFLKPLMSSGAGK